MVATGSDYSYFGHPEWAEFAPGPRSLEDARRIRAQLLTAFERAEASRDPAEQDALMTTVIVGGGPTGVEMAGSVAELARHALARDFRTIDPRRAKIILIEAGPRILSGFPEKLSDYAKTALEKLGVTVITKEAVELIDAKGVVVAGRRIDAGTVIWGAGIKASPAAGMLGAPLDRAGRVPLNPDLSVKGVADVYALGDMANTPDETGDAAAGAGAGRGAAGHLSRPRARQNSRRTASRCRRSNSTTAATPRSSAAMRRCSISAGCSSRAASRG